MVWACANAGRDASRPGAYAGGRYGGASLGGLEAGAALRHVPSEELSVPVLRDTEDSDLAVLEEVIWVASITQLKVQPPLALGESGRLQQAYMIPIVVP